MGSALSFFEAADEPSVRIKPGAFLCGRNSSDMAVRAFWAVPLGNMKSSHTQISRLLISVTS